MKSRIFLKALLIVAVIVSIASCDKDYSDIGTNIIGDNHYGLLSNNYGVLAYNQNIGAVQTNNLSINALGIYKNANPVFGTTKASFVTQLKLATVAPTFVQASTIEIDSVYLYVPYFSKLTATDSNGDSTYTLDSIKGSGNINLKVFESGYYLRDLDPSSSLQDAQRYYSDQKSIFDSAIIGTQLNDQVGLTTDVYPNHSQNDEFEFRANQIKFYKSDKDGVKTTTVDQRLAPGVYLDLNKTFFKNKIINASSDNLLNNTNFTNYFKGLYFQVDHAASAPTGGSMAMLNFAQGKIVIKYRDKADVADTSPKVRSTITLNMSGNTVNLLESSYTNQVPTPNTTIGDDKLYLKGGAGSMAVIDLFAPGELESLRSSGWLINDASLTFTIDENAFGTNDDEPNRVYLYDLTNNRPLIDYYYDSSTSTNPKKNKAIYGGILEETNGKGTQYKFRITNHIRNLVKNDSTNVRLGLVVTEGISNATNVYLKNPFTTTSNSKTNITKYIPAMDVVNPLGTILYGTNPIVPDSKKIKFQIWYTKPE